MFHGLVVNVYERGPWLEESVAWLRLSLLGPREARESRGSAVLRQPPLGPDSADQAEVGTRPSRRRSGRPFVIAAACQAKMLRMMKEHSESLAEPPLPSLWASRLSPAPDPAQSCDPRGTGGMPSSRGALSFLWALFPTDQWGLRLEGEAQRVWRLPFLVSP